MPPIVSRRPRLVWWSVLAATSGIFVLALLPPFLPAELADVVRSYFAPVCHQIPARSPHVGGVPIAICDRCVGIYVGLVFGVLGTGWGWSAWHAIGSRSGQYVLLASLVPMGVDWFAPVVGIWSSHPLSRTLTGFVFGAIAASYIVHRLLDQPTRVAGEEGSDRSELELSVGGNLP